MKILKFGGKSVATIERFNSVADIISDKQNSIVVFPAIPEITYSLEEIANYFYKKNTEGASEIINKLKKYLLNFVSDIYTDTDRKNKVNRYVDDQIEYIRSFSKELFTLFEEKVLMAQGEQISSYLFIELLRERRINCMEIPALEFMKIDKNAEPDMEFIKNTLISLLAEKPSQLYITQGYICRNVYGEIDDFRKGGNDYTATLIGAAIVAEEIQIWTNTDGIHVMDTSVINDSPIIEDLSFDEAAELAYFGDKVLHPTSVLPAKLANIPVRIVSILSPEAKGTLICDDTVKGKIKAVATKDDITAIRISSGKMLLAHGFLRRVFEVFENYRTPIDMLASSEVGISLTIDNAQYLNEIVDELKKYGTVSVDSDMTIVSVIGDLDWRNKESKVSVCEALKHLPVRMISYGGTDYNFSFLVEKKRKEETLHTLNKYLFQNN